jgi:malate dehydrogenase (oxaloacetate-decarboxylating)(NADP+)
VPLEAKRVAYAEGEDERVLRAVQVVVDEGLARPILIGRPAVIEARLLKAGLRLRLGTDLECVNPEDDPRFRQYWETYHRLMGRRGVSIEAAKAAVRRSSTTIAALMLEKRTLFIADAFVNEDPDAEQLASIAVMAADEVRRFGLPPKVAFLSHSMYGSSNRKSAVKMRLAHELFCKMAPDVESDGELHGDAALSEDMRNAALMDSKFHGEANVLICPNLDAANILFNVLKVTGGNGVTVGPILLGAAASAHVLTPSSTVRRVVNMTALAVANADHGKGLSR